MGICESCMHSEDAIIESNLKSSVILNTTDLDSDGEQQTTEVIEIKKFEEKKEVSLSGKDIYEKFELSLPFARSAAFDTFTAIRNDHVKLGKENFVTIESL